MVSSSTVLSAESSKLSIDIDATTFKHSQNQMIWELHYSLPDTAVTYRKDETGYLGEIYIALEIKNSIKTFVAQEWIIENRSQENPVEYKKDLIGSKRFFLPPGDYTAHFRIVDVNDTLEQIEKKVPVYIRSISQDRIDISDLLLATDIQKASDNCLPEFKKSSLCIIPNPQLIYAGEAPLLQVYSEIYNVQTIAPTKCKVVYNLYDINTNLVFSQQYERVSATGLAEARSFALDTLPSGLYYLTVTAYNNTVQPTDSASVQKKVYVLNPSRPPIRQVHAPENGAFEQSEFAVMTDLRIEDLFEKSRYIAEAREKDLFSSLTTVEAKRRFLHEFWLLRDTDRTTLENERLIQFRKDVVYANRFFYEANQKGWQSDRGRTILKYGQPDHVDRSPFTQGAKAYEKWTYSGILGGAQFVFVEISPLRYIQVHSTVPGEQYDIAWFDRYARMEPGSAGSANRGIGGGMGSPMGNGTGFDGSAGFGGRTGEIGP
jgi:GWxTD domain-containing protein